MRTLAVALVLASSTASAATPLRYHWKAGQEIHFHEREVEDGTFENHLQSIKSFAHDERRTGHTWKVLSVDASGVAKIQATYDYVAQRIENKDGVTVSDSRNPHDPYADLIGAIIGKSYTFTIDDRGEIKSVSGVDEMMDALRDRMVKLGIPEDARPAFDAMLSSVVGEDGARSSIQSLVVPFPEQPLAKGDTWKKTIKNDVETAVTTIELEYKVESDPKGKGPLVVSAHGTITSKATAENVELGYDRNAVTVSWTLDPETHAPVALQHTMDVASKAFLKAEGQKVLAIEQTTKQTLKVTSGAPPAEPTWTPAEAKPAVPADAKTVTSIAYSPDGTRFVVGGKIGALVSGIKPQDEPTVLRAPDTISVAFTADHVLTASASGHVTVWSAADGKELRSFDLGTKPSRVGFSPDGTRLAVARENFEIELWDVDAGKKIRTLAKPIEPAAYLSVSRNGKRVVASAPSGFGIVDGESGDVLLAAKPPLSGAVSAVSPDGKFAVVSGKTSLEVWDLDKVEVDSPIGGIEGTPRLLSMSADGKRLAIVTGDKHLYMIERDNPGGLSGDLPGAAVAAIAMRADGSGVVWADVNGDLNTQTFKTVPAPGDAHP